MTRFPHHWTFVRKTFPPMHSWWRHHHFPRYWPSVWGIHRSSVNSPHKGQWRGVLVLSLISAWINSWVNNREAGDLRRHRTNYEIIVTSSHKGQVINRYMFRFSSAWIKNSTKTSHFLGLHMQTTLVMSGHVITQPVKCGMKLLIHSQTSAAIPWKFGNGVVIFNMRGTIE